MDLTLIYLSVMTCVIFACFIWEIRANTYHVEYDQLMKDLGLAPHDRANRVHVVPIDWFYADAGDGLYSNAESSDTGACRMSIPAGVK